LCSRRRPLFFNVWDRIETSEFTDTVVRALAESFPTTRRASWRVRARLPRSECDPQRSGTRRLQRDRDSKLSIISARPSPREPAVAFCQGTPMRNEIEARGAPGLEAAHGPGRAGTGKTLRSGAIEGRIRALVVSAVAL